MTGSAQCDIAIVGGGIVASTCAWALRRDRPNLRLALVAPPPIGGGATAAAAGLATLLTKRQPAALALAAESLRLYEDWLVAGPAGLCQRRSTILIVEDDAQQTEVDALLERVRVYDPFVERLTAREVNDREPRYTGRVRAGLADPASLWLSAVELSQMWTARAVGAAAGALPTEVPTSGLCLAGEVLALEPTVRDGWCVRTSLGNLWAERVVVAAGLATAGLLAPLGWELPLRPRRGQMAITAPTPGVVERALVSASYLTAKGQEAPPSVLSGHWDQLDDVGPVQYHFTVVPDAAGRLWLGGTRRWSTDARVRNDERIAILHGATTRLRGLDIEAIEREVAGLRVWTPDGLPLIGELPDCPGLLVATGHEGDGVSLAPATGRLVADLIAGRTTPRLDAAALRPERFGRHFIATREPDTVSEESEPTADISSEVLEIDSNTD